MERFHNHNENKHRAEMRLRDEGQKKLVIAYYLED